MSKYLKSPDNMLTPNSLELIAHSYILNNLNSSIDKNSIPESFLEDNGKELIQKLLDKSNYKLTMYGSADELVQNLKIYQNFPGSQQFFETKFDPYTTTATIYRSLKNEEYICKSDLFVILQNMALDVFSVGTSFVLRYVIFINLRDEQKKLPHRMKFIKFDQNLFDEIEMEMREARKLCFMSDSEKAVLSAQLAAGSFDTMVAKFQKVYMIKQDPNEICEDSDEILLYLKDSYSRHLAENQNPAKKMVVNLVWNAARNCFYNIFNVKRPEIFLPSSTNKTPMIVRLFEDGDQQFVMESELAIAMCPEKASEIIAGRGKVGFHNYTTITLDEALRQGAGRVEFIRYPIKRAKHRAVPIEGPDPEDPNDWCILAVDAFFEYMKSAITGFKIFQKYMFQNYPNSFLYFECFFRALEEIFKCEVESPYFVQIESINYLLAKVHSSLKMTRPAKDVRNAEPDGFTVEDLKNELNHLDLSVLLPEIFDYAEDVYEEIDKSKKERYLRTCDLIDAVENCQLICVLNRIPNLRMFLHNQKGCKRVLGYKCEHCEKEKNALDALEVSKLPAEVQKTSDIQDSMKNLKNESTNSSILNQCSQPAPSAPKGCDESSKSLKEAETELKMCQNQVMDMEKELSETNEINEKTIEESTNILCYYCFWSSKSCLPCVWHRNQDGRQ